jgi:hypothetical protein
MMIKGEMGRDFVKYQTSSNLIEYLSFKRTVIRKSCVHFLVLILLASIFQGYFGTISILAHQDEVFSVWPAELGNRADQETDSFFYLLTEPGEEQQISVRLVNLTDEYQTIEVTAHVATTTNEGSICYWGREETPVDTTLPHNIEDLLLFAPVIELEPNEELYLWITVRMPIMPYQGVLAGGLVFRALGSPFSDETFHEERMLSILLRQDGFVESNIVIGEWVLEVVDWQSVIRANLRNVAANFVGKMRITTQVRDSNGEIIFTNIKEDMYMAPNSSFWYEVGFDDLRMSTDIYEITFNMVSGPYSWERVIEVNGTGTIEILPEPEPEPIIEEEITTPQTPALMDEENLSNLLLALLIIGGIFTLTLIVVSIHRSKKMKEDGFEELQGQIMATLMSDEEPEIVIPMFESEKTSKKKATLSDNKKAGKDKKDQEKKVTNKGKAIEEIKRATSEIESEVSQEIDDEANSIEKSKKNLENEENAAIGKNKALSSKEDVVGKKEKALEKKEKELEKKVKEIENKEKDIIEKVKTIEEKVKSIEEKQRELEKKEEEQKEREEKAKEAAKKKRKKIPERKKEEWDIEI